MESGRGGGVMGDVIEEGRAKMEEGKAGIRAVWVCGVAASHRVECL